MNLISIQKRAIAIEMAALTRCPSCNNVYSCSHRAALKDLPRMGETIVPFSTVRLLTLSFSLCVFFLPLPAPNGRETKRGWKAVFLWSLLGWRSETRPGAAPYSPYQPSCSCLFSASYNLSTTRTSVLIPCLCCFSRLFSVMARVDEIPNISCSKRAIRPHPNQDPGHHLFFNNSPTQLLW